MCVHRLNTEEIVVAEWKKVLYKGVEYPYTVSDEGEVKTQKGVTLAPWKRGTRKGRYPCVGLWLKGKRTVVDVHRLVAIHFVPNPRGKEEVNHYDCDMGNCRASNLEWVTRSENECHKKFMEAFETKGVTKVT